MPLSPTDNRLQKLNFRKQQFLSLAFFNTVEEYVHHPLFPKYKGRLIFDDADALVEAIKRCLDQRDDTVTLVEPGDLDGYNAGGDEAGLERFREEALMRAGLISR